MVISCWNGNTQACSTSNLELGFTMTTVWSRRLGEFAEKNYP
jgi:hypothetical protein